MPKEEVEKLANETVSRAERENSELISLSKRLYLIAWILIAVTISLLVVLGIQSSNQNQLTINTISLSEEPLPPWALLIIFSPIILFSASVGLLTFTIPFFKGIRSNPRGMILDPLAIPRMQKRLSIISMIAIVPSIAVLLAAVGFVNILFEFLKNVVLPGFTNLINMIVANLVNWALSGVIGNFIYDLLKKIVLREKRERKQNAK
jgi:hypothetical protein